MPWVAGGDNIDLFPEGFLVERGCSIERGDRHRLRTPRGNDIDIHVWGTLPYLMKRDLDRVLADLPDAGQIGRSGLAAESPKAARACAATTTTEDFKTALQHLVPDMGRKRVTALQKKCRNLPDLYYNDDVDSRITPRKFAQLILSERLLLGGPPSERQPAGRTNRAPLRRTALPGCGSTAAAPPPSALTPGRTTCRTCPRSSTDTGGTPREQRISC